VGGIRPVGPIPAKQTLDLREGRPEGGTEIGAYATKGLKSSSVSAIEIKSLEGGSYESDIPIGVISDSLVGDETAWSGNGLRQNTPEAGPSMVADKARESWSASSRLSGAWCSTWTFTAMCTWTVVGAGTCSSPSDPTWRSTCVSACQSSSSSSNGQALE
jgi:hypothetical protein